MLKSNHSKMFQCLRNGSFLIWWTLWLPDILGFRFIVVIALNNAMFLLYLRDVEGTDFQPGMLQDIFSDFLIGCLALCRSQSMMIQPGDPVYKYAQFYY